ncbi:MAG: PP2C family protein-serine/threonine phosphatase [Chloroflexaceae bacterium]|nr:PP2C family protein-serine/threonine phosphatase [Chloroflexaceae bacterium]
MRRSDPFAYRLIPTLWRRPRHSRSTLLEHRGMETTNRWSRLKTNHQPPDPGDQVPQLSEEDRRRQAELEKDLQLARDIQQGMLLAAVPYLHGWEFSAVSLPARDLGGDLYDFLPLRNGHQAIMIGDVSGKGLQAALRMAVARTLFRYEARHGESPAMTLASVNRGVCSDIPHGMVTMLYAILNPGDGTVRIANAGHTYPLLFKGKVQEFELPGLPLGVDPDIDYDEEETIMMAPGESLFLYTDGVNEATDPDEREFGFERLQKLLEASSQVKPRTLMKLILNELRTWSDGNAQSDDITMVVLRRRFAGLGDELRVVAADVLGHERAGAFWGEVEVMLPCAPNCATPDDWMALLAEISALAKKLLSRGLARELSQEVRMTIEEYRYSDA